MIVPLSPAPNAGLVVFATVLVAIVILRYRKGLVVSCSELRLLITQPTQESGHTRGGRRARRRRRKCTPRTNIMMFRRRRATAWRECEPPGALIRRRA